MSWRSSTALLVGLAVAACAAHAAGDGESGASAEVSTSAPPAPPADAGAPPTATPTAPTAAAPTGTPTGAARGGLAPRPMDAPVPQAWLPPGAFRDDTGPSAVVFPPQKITIRFNHKLHMTKIAGTTCATCHPAALTSSASSDRLLPAVAKCDGCHLSDHKNLAAVTPGPDEEGQCSFCHIGYQPGAPVAPLVLKAPNLVFNHQKHAARNIGCAQCHGKVEELELATRDQLPRMRGCFNCHVFPDAAARGSAKSACTTCHIAARAGDPKAGTMRVLFAEGALSPPRWLRGASHTPDWIERHKKVAGADSSFCASCHKEETCTDCHDGRVRPRSVHPSDYLNMHATEARLMAQRCQSCHQEQSFCLTCHQRAGVSRSGPTAVRESGRFHPPAAVWSQAGRGVPEHAKEARRNLSACVSCHVERDCVVCHGAAGVGGRGFSPHPPSFAATCSAPMRRNARPCFVCHEPNAAALAPCR